MKNAQSLSKTSVQIWRPLLKNLNAKFEAACLRRDAYLAKVLQAEIPELAAEVSSPNSQEARYLVASRLEALPRKLVSVSLPGSLVSQLNDVCAEKNIVRDAFFNRLFFLLAATPKAIDALYFNGSDEWRREVWSELRNDGPFFQNVFYPLDPDIDPLWGIRAGLELDAETAPTKNYVYTVVFNRKIGDADLVAFSCHLPDSMVPGHPAELEATKKLDEFLAGL